MPPKSEAASKKTAREEKGEAMVIESKKKLPPELVRKVVDTAMAEANSKGSKFVSVMNKSKGEVARVGTLPERYKGRGDAVKNAYKVGIIVDLTPPIKIERDFKLTDIKDGHKPPARTHSVVVGKNAERGMKQGFLIDKRWADA